MMTKLYDIESTSVMLLAAGKGQRMLPLTESTPKALLKVDDKPLIEHHLIRLAALGFKHIIINLAYLGEHIRSYLGDGQRFGLCISYSNESDSGALETAGGIRQALHLINSDPFLVINADIWTDYPFTQILTPLSQMARLILVENPNHNKLGDFSISLKDNLLNETYPDSLNATFSGVSLFRKTVFEHLPQGKLALAPVLHKLIKLRQLEGVFYDGVWIDIGTPQRLAELNKSLLCDSSN